MVDNSPETVIPKIPFKLKVRGKYSAIVKKLRKNKLKLKDSNDFKTIVGMFSDMILSGLFITAGMYLFGLPVNYITFICAGAFYVFFSDKILPQLIAILNSLTLVKIR